MRFRALVLGCLLAIAQLIGAKQSYSQVSNAQRPAWSGFYVGAGGGGLFVNTQGDFLGDLTAPSAAALAQNRDDLGFASWFGTLQVGYDVRLAPRFVAGAFADIDFAGGEGKSVYWNNTNNFTGVGGAPKLSVDTMWTAGGRLGYLASPGTLLYALAGYSRIEFNDNWQSYATRSLQSRDGYTLGGGVETRLGDGWGLKFEYRWSGFGEQTVLLGPACAASNDCNNRYDISTQSARLLLTYHFDAGARAPSFAPTGPVRWTGFGIGGGIGGVFVSQALDTTNFGYKGVDDYGAHGVLGTVQISYDQRLGGGFLGGVFADLDVTSASVRSDYYNNAGAARPKPRSDLSSSWTLGARFGLLATPDTLVYGLIGYTQAEFSDSDLVYARLGRIDGFTLGGGLETALTGNLFLKGEYRYTDFGTHRQPFTGAAVGFSDLDNTVSTHSVRAVLTYKFAGGL